MSRSIATVLVALTLVLSSCAADPVAEPTGACRWLTAEDVAEAVGVVVDDGRPSALETSCRYGDFPDPRVIVDVLVDRDIEGYRLAERSAGDDRSRLVDIGDEAFVWSQGGARFGGEAIIGETRFSVVISDEADSTEATSLDGWQSSAKRLLSILVERGRTEFRHAHELPILLSGVSTRNGLNGLIRNGPCDPNGSAPPWDSRS